MDGCTSASSVNKNKNALRGVHGLAGGNGDQVIDILYRAATAKVIDRTGDALKDGTHYVSEQLSLPSLASGEETKLVATDFSETDEPYQGAGSETFGGPIEFDYPEWLFTDSFPS